MFSKSERAIVRVDPQGRLLVPKEIRAAIDMRPGENVTLLVEGRELRVVTVSAARDHFRRMKDKYNPEGRSLVDELIADRRAEAERE